ncbi:helix-turn-helix domain-containing protein [Sinomicrobium sp. M5D2P9]
MDSEYQKEEFLHLFGQQIDKIREIKGYSYRDIATRSKLSASDISKFAKGRVNITLSSIMELAKGLNVHPKELFDFDVPMETERG